MTNYEILFFFFFFSILEMTQLKEIGRIWGRVFWKIGKIQKKSGSGAIPSTKIYRVAPCNSSFHIFIVASEFKKEHYLNHFVPLLTKGSKFVFLQKFLNFTTCTRTTKRRQYFEFFPNYRWAYIVFDSLNIVMYNYFLTSENLLIFDLSYLY